MLCVNPATFEVGLRVVGAGAYQGDSVSTKWPRPLFSPPVASGPQGQNNSDFPYDFLPFNGEFDTFTTRVANWQAYVANATPAAQGLPVKPFRVIGAMIRVRAYDPRNQNARQTTIHATP